MGFLITIIFFGGYRVSDKDMSPAFKPGDYIFINRFKSPDVGDVVLIKSPLQSEKQYLVRVVAEAGSVVKIDQKKVFVNGEVVSFPFTSSDPRIFTAEQTGRDTYAEKIVPEEELFVIGDNWDYSFDSRYFGVISEDLVQGVVFLKM